MSADAVTAHTPERWQAEDFDYLAKAMRSEQMEGHALADDLADMAEQAARDLRTNAELVAALRDAKDALRHVVTSKARIGEVTRDIAREAGAKASAALAKAGAA